MDRKLRDLQRKYAITPTTENLIKVLHEQLRIGQPVELTSQIINDNWDDPTVRNFIAQLPKFNWRVCGEPLRVSGATRTSLLRHIHDVIAQDFNYLYYEQEVHEAREALNGEFNIMQTAFSPNGEDAARFLVITLFNTGYAQHLIDFECDWELEQWEIITEFIEYWYGRPGLDYHEPCDKTCTEAHRDTEEHIFEVDAIRADEISGHFNLLLRNEFDQFIDLNLRGY